MPNTSEMEPTQDETKIQQLQSSEKNTKHSKKKKSSKKKKKSSAEPISDSSSSSSDSSSSSSTDSDGFIGISDLITHKNAKKYLTKKKLHPWLYFSLLSNSKIAKVEDLNYIEIEMYLYKFISNAFDRKEDQLRMKVYLAVVTTFCGLKVLNRFTFDSLTDVLRSVIYKVDCSVMQKLFDLKDYKDRIDFIVQTASFRYANRKEE